MQTVQKKCLPLARVGWKRLLLYNPFIPYVQYRVSKQRKVLRLFWSKVESHLGTDRLLRPTGGGGGGGGGGFRGGGGFGGGVQFSLVRNMI